MWKGRRVQTQLSLQECYCSCDFSELCKLIQLCRPLQHKRQYLLIIIMKLISRYTVCVIPSRNMQGERNQYGRQVPYQYLRASIIENTLNTLPGNRNTLMLTFWLFIQFALPKQNCFLPPSLT